MHLPDRFDALCLIESVMDALGGAFIAFPFSLIFSLGALPGLLCLDATGFFRGRLWMLRGGG